MIPPVPDLFEFHVGTTPLLINVPHDGRRLVADMRDRMTPAGLDLPDTDWDVAKLYAFARELGASILVANYSRYVVDLNRPADDADLYPGRLSTGLCPAKSFTGHDLYIGGAQVDADEIMLRRERFWQPYHDRLEVVLSSLRDSFGYALLWDAHSIPSMVPRLFEGVLPALNIGSFDEQSADSRITSRVASVAEQSGYELSVNGRFKGGYITRHYGRPDDRVHALQLEIAQRAYMDEDRRQYDDDKAATLIATVRPMLETFLSAADELYA